MSTPTIAAPIAFDQMLETLVPEGFLKLFVESGGELHDSWFRRIDNQWWEQGTTGVFAERPTSGFEYWIGRHRQARVTFNPCAWKTLYANDVAFLFPLRAVWASVPLVKVPISLAAGLDTLSGAYRIDPGSQLRAQAVVDAALPCSALIDEGDRLSLVWVLDAPLPPDRAGPLLTRIAQTLGLPRASAQTSPCAARLGIPGSTSYDLIPAKLTAVESWRPDLRYRVADLEAWAGGAP